MEQDEKAGQPLAVSDADQMYIDRFRLMDDDFMRLVFDGDKEAAEELLKVILEQEDIVVIKLEAQKEIKGARYKGRTIRLDIYAKDSTGKVYDIEIQREDAGASEKRARYHSSAIDAKALKAKQPFDALPESYVIFITEHDIYKANLPMYHIERQIQELSIAFKDDAHIIYVNGEYKNDEDPVGRLMHDFRCSNPDDMFSPVLAERVRYFKREEGGRAIMCKMMEQLRNESKAEGIQEGIQKGIRVGKREGIQEGVLKGKAEIVLSYMKKHMCDAEAAMDEFNISAADRVIIRPMLALN